MFKQINYGRRFATNGSQINYFSKTRVYKNVFQKSNALGLQLDKRNKRKQRFMSSTALVQMSFRILEIWRSGYFDWLDGLTTSYL